MKMMITNLILISILILVSCSSDNSTGPQMEPLAATSSVIVTGTSVDDNFLQSGQLTLTAIPLDDNGTAILSNDLTVEITISEPRNIDVAVSIENINAPSNLPKVAAVSIDGSGSMANTDPQRMRVEGARNFVDFLEMSGQNYEVAAFSFRGQPDFRNFFDTQLLHDFSSEAPRLKNAFNQIDASGNTPTYESLLEVIPYLDSNRVAMQYDRSIVLFSDGAPTTFSDKDAVCDLIRSLNLPVYCIGLGPASDISIMATALAVNNLRDIANSGGGAYYGLPDNDSRSITEAFENIASSIISGNIKLSAAFSGPGFDALRSGSTVSGVVTISSTGGFASAPFEFGVF